MLNVDLAKAFASKVKPSAIWVYDNGVLLNGSPFSSFASAMEAIGYSKTSIAGRRSIDTKLLVLPLREGAEREIYFLFKTTIIIIIYGTPVK